MSMHVKGDKLAFDFVMDNLYKYKSNYDANRMLNTNGRVFDKVKVELKQHGITLVPISMLGENIDVKYTYSILLRHDTTSEELSSFISTVGDGIFRRTKCTSPIVYGKLCGYNQDYKLTFFLPEMPKNKL